MANSKISALTSATTPLAGTEVLPLVQSSTTKQVSVANLTAGRNVATANLDASGYIAQTGSNSSTSFTGSADPASVYAINTSSTTGSYSGYGIEAKNAGGLTQVAVMLAQTTASGYASNLIFGFRTAASATTQRAQLTGSTGDFTLNTGNLVIGTSGKGIDFSATAGTGTSELLADYEEGTWTPTITGSTSAGTGTYTTQIGRYVKVGNMVYCQAYILWTNHTGTGNFWLTGLPYTLFATTDNHPSGSIGLLANVALTAGNIATTYGSPNTTRFNLVQYPTGGGAASSVPIDTAGEIIYNVCYYAA